MILRMVCLGVMKSRKPPNFWLKLFLVPVEKGLVFERQNPIKTQQVKRLHCLFVSTSLLGACVCVFFCCFCYVKAVVLQCNGEVTWCCSPGQAKDKDCVHFGTIIAVSGHVREASQGRDECCSLQLLSWHPCLPSAHP